MKSFALASIVVVCLLVHSINAATFKCDDDPQTCKTKFGEEFQRRYKAIHLPGTKKLLKTFVDQATNLKSKMAAGDPHVKRLEQSIDGVSKSINRLNNENDANQIARAIDEAVDNMVWIIRGVPDTQEFKQLLKSENTRNALFADIHEATRDCGNLWAEMYSGLRDQDLTTYPEYEEVNRLMENLRMNTDRPARGSDFTNAIAILAVDFDLPYFQALTHIKN